MIVVQLMRNVLDRTKKINSIMFSNSDNEVKVTAVHDNQLVDTLKSFNLYEQMQKGELTCKFCQEKMTIENLYGLLPQNNGIKLICDDQSCIDACLDQLREGEISL